VSLLFLLSEEWDLQSVVYSTRADKSFTPSICADGLNQASLISV
jgi:hypothetical protein